MSERLRQMAKTSHRRVNYLGRPYVMSELEVKACGKDVAAANESPAEVLKYE